MAYEITYARSALKALRKVYGETARRILRAIDALANDTRPPGCLQLSGGDGELRIRVGYYRIVYEVVDSELVVLVLRLGHRREVYR